MASKTETYELILTAAAEIFDRFGPRRTTVAEIARAVRMSPANVYKFFPSKNSIIEAVGQRFMVETHLKMSPLINARKPAWDRIEDVVRSVNQHFCERFDSKASLHGAAFFQNVIEFEIMRREHKWQFVHEFLYTTLHNDIRKLLRQGMEDREFRLADPSETALEIVDCLISSIAPIMLIGESPTAIGQRLDRQLRLIHRAII
jgi:AcrR family transcriptional regulator